ncbi:MAG TPA: LysR family transcriptional regulator [Acidimicrobiales bacterium]|nr:LysR family transcriptional regulator [Acidimicrobiales bacterium]
MELRHLQALVAVAEHGSFSSAADHLGTVQSNVSAHVARLERELGAVLVDRSAGRLTAEGEVVVARAHLVMSELDALKADVSALREAVVGNVRVGMIGTTARWLVPMLLAELAERHPRLNLVVADGTTMSLEPQLAAGRFDLAVLSVPVPGRDLVVELLFEEDLVLVVPVENDPLAGDERLDLADLDRFELLLPAPGTPFRGEIDAAVKPAGVRLRPRAELDGVRLLASLTFEGYGPAVLPASAVPPHLRPRFRLVAVDGLAPRRVGVARRSRGLPSAPARAVHDTMRDLVAMPGRLPPGLRPTPSEHSRRAEGSLRAVGMPNG